MSEKHIGLRGVRKKNISWKLRSRGTLICYGPNSNSNRDLSNLSHSSGLIQFNNPNTERRGTEGGERRPYQGSSSARKMTHWIPASSVPLTLMTEDQGGDAGKEMAPGTGVKRDGGLRKATTTQTQRECTSD